MLPARLADRLRMQIDAVDRRWREDLTRGGGYAPVPHALLHKSAHAPDPNCLGSSSFPRRYCVATSQDMGTAGIPIRPRWIGSCT
jgi:hypothetical protein